MRLLLHGVYVIALKDPLPRVFRRVFWNHLFVIIMPFLVQAVRWGSFVAGFCTTAHAVEYRHSTRHTIRIESEDAAGGFFRGTLREELAA